MIHPLVVSLVKRKIIILVSPLDQKYFSHLLVVPKREGMYILSSSEFQNGISGDNFSTHLSGIVGSIHRSSG